MDDLAGHAVDVLFDSPVLFQSLSDMGMFAVDYEHGRVFASSVWKKCGYGEQSMGVENLAKVLHDDDRVWVMPRLQDLLEGRSDRFECVFRLWTKSRDLIWVAANYRVAHRAPSGRPLLFVGHDQDVTAIKRSEDEQRRRAREVDTLRQVVADINSSLDLKETITSILTHTSRLIPHHKATVQLVEGNRIRIVGSVGFLDQEAPLSLEIPYPENNSPSTRAIQDQVPVVCNDVPTDFPEFRHVPGEDPVLSWLGIPLVVGGEAIGLLALDSTELNFYTVEHVTTAEVLAAHLALAIDKARTFENVRSMALTDSLTKTGNRHALQMQGPFFLEKAKREQKPVVAIMADLDRFKAINDTLGHLAGDQILRRCAELLREGLRAYDLLYRYGGEEFLMILPDTDLAEAKAVAERIRRTAETGLSPTTVSFGVVSMIPRGGQTLSDLIRQADRALYRAKSKGRNRVEVEDQEKTLPGSLPASLGLHPEGL